MDTGSVNARQQPVARLGEQHQKMLDWMLINYTGKNLGEMAAHFGYSQSWISQVINSDLFRAELGRRRAELNGDVRARIVQKTMVVAEKALEKLDDHISSLDSGDKDFDPRFILDVADKTLHRLGYAPTRGGDVTGNVVHQNTFLLVDREVAQEARNRILQRAAAGPVTIECEPSGAQ